MKNVLVLGSNSFSGSSFINHLLNNNYKILGISRSIESKKFYCPYFNNKKIKNLTFYKLDINKDMLKILDLINKFKPNYIINYSAQSMVGESWNSPLDWYRTNVIGTIDLIENIKKKKFIKKYIHFSTPEVYGSTQSNISENNFFNPSTPYAVSRAAADFHINLLNKEINFPSIITRASNVYGEYQDLYRIIPITILKIMKKEKMFLHGGGLSKRSFIHIDDVNKALHKIIVKGEIGETYHISTLEKISIVNLVKKICKKMSYNFDDLVVISDDRVGKDKNYYLNSKKIREGLNWNDKIKIDGGIQRVINWLEVNFKDLNRIPSKYIHKK